MSQTEETPKPTQELEAKDDIPADLADELEIVDAMKPAAAPASNNKPLKYGTRRKKAGEAGPNIQSLGSVSSLDEEEEIEMDDLPIKANAPEELIDTRKSPSEPRDEDGESRPRRQNRSRGERRERKPRNRSSESNETSAPQTETESAASAPEEQDRPDRFGTVKRAPSDEGVQEFRPSRDGRTAPKRERRPKAEAAVSVPKPKKKGLLAKIISFFTGGEDEKKETEAKGKQDRNPNRNRRGRGKRGPQNRGPREENGEGNGNNNRRRRRPRNRKPRQDGESGGRPRGEGQGNGNGNRRRRRKPRNQGNRDRKETTAE